MKKKVCAGRITSPFGVRRDPFMPTTWSSHNGIDIAANVGTPVICPIDGVVSALYDNQKGGKTLILRSNCGTLRFGFCHLNNYLVFKGQSVVKGERIAHTGNTGNSTGPHLHFSVKSGGKWNTYGDYIGGRWTDPMPYYEFDVY